MEGSFRWKELGAGLRIGLCGAKAPPSGGNPQPSAAKGRRQTSEPSGHRPVKLKNLFHNLRALRARPPLVPAAPPFPLFRGHYGR